MASAALITILAYAHVLSAFGWLGGGMLVVFVIAPSSRDLAPPSALDFVSKVLSKILRFIEITIVTTLLFGFLLLYFFSGGDFSWLMNSTQGYVLSTGIVVALIAAGLDFSVVVPGFRKVIAFSNAALQSKQPPPPEMGKYRARAGASAMAAVLMLLFVLATMITSGFFY